MQIRSWWSLALVVLAFLPADATTTDAADSIGIRLAEIPASAADDPRARLYIVDHLAPGTTISRRVEISSTADAAAQVGLYAAAATITGGAFLGSDGRTANDLSSWTTITPGEVDIPANGTMEGSITIDVPADAAPGEHYAVVWAEVRAGEDANGVVMVSRVGIRIYLSVGPGGPPAANFVIESLTASRTSDGQPVVVATVKNTGGRALDMSGTLDLGGGPGDLSAGPFDARLGTTLAVGESEPVTVALDNQVPAGPWDATITLRSGLLEISANATITFPDNGEAARVDIWAAQQWLLYLVALVVIAGIAGAYALRRPAKASHARKH